MKHFIWMLCGIFISGLLLGSLSACGADQFGISVITTTSQPAPSEAAPAEAPPPGKDAAPDEETDRTYAQVLRDALLSGVLPGGEGLDWTSAEAAAENQFAVCDLNGDGEEELLLRWTNASTAGTADFVFRYSGGEVSREFSEFAGVEFYPNGVAKAPWSHSQGWAGRFWPYNLYQYDRETGTYAELGAVDAWDLSITEGDEALAAAFPKDVDADGDGLVYYILTGEWYANSRTPSDGNLDGRLWGVDPVDGPDHESWLNAYTGGAEVVRLPLQALTEENIAALE